MKRILMILTVVTGTTLADAWPLETQAALVMEPVINRVAGSGPAENNFPLYNPDFLIDGVAYWLANDPGEIDSYVAGYPRDPFLDVFHVWNNTNYEITGLHFKYVGTGTDTQNPGTVVRGPFDAVWGDANNDGQIGQSDIFSDITVSADGTELHMTGGVLPVGGRFTDIHWSTSTLAVDLVAVDSWFTGVAVPEPSTLWLALLAGGLCAAAARKKTGRSLTSAPGILVTRTD